MTNEQLAVLIQQGQKEYYAQLWEQNKRLIYQLMKRLSNACSGKNYVDIDDFIQCGYFALVGAVKAYKADKGYKFATYLSYQTKIAIRGLFGVQKNNLKIEELSYNKPIDSEEETELLDLIANKRATDLYKCFELAELKETVRQAVAELPQDERTVIARHHLKGEAYNSIAKDMNVDIKQVRRYRQSGLSLLRHNKKLLNLYCL